MLGAPLLGVDVSEYQGTINWKEVAASGHVFAGIKATEGVGFRDPTFSHNWHGSLDNGIIRIAYHFLRPEYSGREQADFMHGFVRDNGHFHIGDGVMLDIEETDGVSAAHIVECAEQFITRILEQTHCGVFIYTGYYFWIDSMNNAQSKILGKCPLWQASWNSTPHPIAQWPNGPALQQYAANGRVPGIPEQVDLDWAFCDKNTLKALCKLGGRH